MPEKGQTLGEKAYMSWAILALLLPVAAKSLQGE